MITKEQAVSARLGDSFHYCGRRECSSKTGPRGAITISVVRVRVTGKCQTWKTRPTEWRLPVKYGLYESTAIEHSNAEQWHRAADCPLRRVEADTNGNTVGR